MQVKTIMRHYYALGRMANIKKTVTTLNASKDAEKLDDSHVAGENERQYACSGKTVWQFL